MIGAPSRYPDIVHASRFFAPDPIALLLINNSLTLAVSPMEWNRAKAVCSHANVLTAADLGLPQRATLARCAMELLDQQHIKHIVVPDWLPIRTARTFEKAGFTLTNDEGGLLRERAIKDAVAVEHIDKAQRASFDSFLGAVEIIRRARIRKNGELHFRNQPLTAERLRQAIQMHLLEAGYETPLPPIVACGKLAADPHETGCGTLKAYEPIVLDIFPRCQRSGYWGDLTRTVFRGTPPDRLMRMYEAVAAAQQAAFTACQPGATCSAVHNEALRIFKQHGFETNLKTMPPFGFTHSTGHGVGLDIHELPRLAKGQRTRLRAGHVVTIEPGLYYPEEAGIRIEDIVAVTPRAHRILGRIQPLEHTPILS